MFSKISRKQLKKGVFLRLNNRYREICLLDSVEKRGNKTWYGIKIYSYYISPKNCEVRDYISTSSFRYIRANYQIDDMKTILFSEVT
jgi:hypothetical protein